MVGPHRLICVAKVDIQGGHGFDNCHDGLQGVAVDDRDELHALFQ